MSKEVTVPLLDDWEKQWMDNPQKITKPAVAAVDLQAGQTGAGGTEREAPVAAACQAKA